MVRITYKLRMILIHRSPPAGRKITFVLEELGLKYETIFLDFQSGEHKGPEYLKINPNGRIPALIDHNNNNYSLWYAYLIMARVRAIV